MYLARREFGECVRIYELQHVYATPQAWGFDPKDRPSYPDNVPGAPICGPGHAATGETRFEALANLATAEELNLGSGDVWTSPL